MHGECHGALVYHKTFRKQSHWICRRQLAVEGRSTVPVLVIRKCGPGSILILCFDAVTDWTGAIASLIRRWIVTAWLLLSSPFHPLTRPHPFTGTDWTCNRQQGALGQVTWQGVVRQTARHCNLLADEISISITVNAYSHIGVSGEASEHCNRRFWISAYSLKKRLCVPGVCVFSPMLKALSLFARLFPL